MAKKIDPKAKAKKQKIYAAVGGVLLLGLLAFQVPRTMKMLHPPSADSAAQTAPAATTPTSGPIAAPSLSGGNAAGVSAPAAAGELVDPDAVPLPQSGQLLAFGLFRTKDPFAQQLNLTCAPSSDSTGGEGAACPTKAAPASGAPPAKTPPSDPRGVPSRGVPTGAAPPTVAVLTTAVILVNGESESVTVGGQFPTTDPAFTLVSLTATTAKVGIAGGSFESGSPTVTLKKNKPVTLMNTADGTRYVLRLVSIS
jgi:hypothetical protein